MFLDRKIPFRQPRIVSRTDHEKTLLQREIDAADQKIDELVYGLTEEEIKNVEGV
jgi:DNA-binding MarR family transcriptional regulator